MKGKSLNKTASNIVQSADHITAVGTAVVRYGLVVVITWIGLMKFTGSEAMRIQQFISHSPFMSWLNGILSIRAQSDVIGTIEILAAVLIVLNVVSPRLGAVGGALGTLLFVITLSFLFTTPGIADTAAGGFPALSRVGEFLIKDIVLLGASILALGQSLTAKRSPSGADQVSAHTT
jgi:reactive chlorine resistance protein C